MESTESNASSVAVEQTSSGRLGVRNVAEPLRFRDVEPLMGFSLEATRPGEQVRISTRSVLTSDDPFFHRLLKGLDGVVANMAQQAGTHVRLDRANVVLLVLKEDKTAELWLDAAAVSLDVMVKRAVSAGSPVYDRDIADILNMRFPCVEFDAKDRVLCIFRQDWRFGMVFDFNNEGELDVKAFNADLGKLYRELRYSHFYAALADRELFDRLVLSGWFPFVEIVPEEFEGLLDHCTAGFDMAEAEDKLVASFDEDRLEHLYQRWSAKPHFQVKMPLLKAALDAFGRKEPVAVIKIVLTEIEGVLNEAYRAAHDGKDAKLAELRKFAIDSAERKSGGSDSLLFPAAFAQYLDGYTFANFDPAARDGSAGSRHAVGHGSAAAESYTMARALQAILTLDQFAFYT